MRCVLSDDNPVNRSQPELPAGSVVDILKDLFDYVSNRSKAGIAVAQEKGRHQLEIRQLRKDRNKRLEKLGREVMALIDAGELDHPGLNGHTKHILALDERIQALVLAETDPVGLSSEE